MLNTIGIYAQQNNTHTGKVLDDKNQPLQGVTVSVKNSKSQTSTDAAGAFQINITGNNAQLVLSSVGFASQEVEASAGKDVTIIMQPTSSTLNDVVVIGYGSVKKSDLTGSVSTVSSDKITKVKAVSSVAQTLQGQAAGVQVNQASGQPEESVIIKIRGTNSIGAGNALLYVIDGLPIDNTTGSNLSAQLNPDDIANIQVLKDASSVAIYGSRGANGVILITTKKGRDGKTQVFYNGYFGVQTLRKKLDLINASEYAELQNEVVANDNESGLNPTQLVLPWTAQQIDSLKGKGIDWQDKVYKPANVQNHDLSISGGNKNTKYYTSFGYYNQDGIINNSNFRRFSFRTNLDQKIASRINMTTSLSLQHSRYFSLTRWRS